MTVCGKSLGLAASNLGMEVASLKPIGTPKRVVIALAGGEEMKVRALLAIGALWLPHAATAQAADSVGQVLGHIYSVETGQALVGAEIVLPALGISTLSDSQGHFTLKDVPAGPNFARASYLGHRAVEWILTVESGKPHQLEVRMYVEAIELTPILVKVRSGRWMENIEALRHRMRQGLGDYVTRREIEQRPQSWNITQLLRGIAGVRVTETSRGSTLFLRGGGTLGDCLPTLYVDGREWQRDNFSGLDSFQASDLEAIEVYKSSITAPAQYRGGNCGTVIIWTRIGGRPPGGG